jgi:anti-anti-sigma regulatory factor
MSISPVNKMVTTMAFSADRHAVCVFISGDIDMAGEPDLAILSGQLAATECASVYIDLAGITFAGSTLVNFVFRLTGQLPEHIPVILCRPRAFIRQILERTAMDQLAAVRGDLPPGWTVPPADVGVPSPIVAAAA